MALLAAGHALAGARSLWLQKESGEVHRRKIPWSYGHSLTLHKYTNLKQVKVGKAAFPKSWKYHDTFALFS